MCSPQCPHAGRLGGPESAGDRAAVSDSESPAGRVASLRSGRTDAAPNASTLALDPSRAREARRPIPVLGRPGSLSSEPADSATPSPAGQSARHGAAGSVGPAGALGDGPPRRGAAGRADESDSGRRLRGGWAGRLGGAGRLSCVCVCVCVPAPAAEACTAGWAELERVARHQAGRNAQRKKCTKMRNIQRRCPWLRGRAAAARKRCHCAVMLRGGSSLAGSIGWRLPRRRIFVIAVARCLAKSCAFKLEKLEKFQNSRLGNFYSLLLGSVH